MRSNLTKIVLAAALVLAITLTLSCSSGGDDDGGGINANSNGQDGLFNEDPQIYNKNGSRFTGSGVVLLQIRDKNGNDTTIKIMSVKDGIVKLELPVYPDKYPYNDGWLSDCDVSPEGTILSYEDDFPLFDNSGEKYIGSLMLGYSDNGSDYLVFLLYSPVAAKVTCDNETHKVDIDAKAGWNKVYAKSSCYEDTNGEEVCGKGIVSTNNFFTKEAKWTIETE